MRKLLQIGEVAHLQGITTKTIRHYHKIGLLQEPMRTDAGYRLYGAQDLARLQQIRQLQSLGLPLKLIKVLLGEPTQEHSLREILTSLDKEFAQQITDLEERRTRIHTLLQEEVLPELDQPLAEATILWVKDLLGDYAEKVSPEALVLEAKLWATIQNFNWPAEFSSNMRGMAQQLATHTSIIERVIHFHERITALAIVPEDAPEVIQLVDDFIQDAHLMTFIQDLMALREQHLTLASPFVETLGELMSTSLSPAQQRFFAELVSRRPFDVATPGEQIEGKRVYE